MTPYLTPLDVETLRAEGIPEPWSYGMKDRVRFGEIDALNHVNNTAYLRWFEQFRTRYLRDYGISDYGPEAPVLVLRQVQVDYLAELKFNEDYIVVGRSSQMRRSSWVMEYAVYAGGTLRTTSSAVIVLLNPDGSGKMAIPEDVRSTLRARDNALDI
ncbi:thioesterase family protein [Cognatishimia sp. MH4019]|uniref:acyl-CoA thioesterase n=1 Tax=Cognatishimia sp. MH4019 TaxID=2854030 RepID=UPI001CD6C0F3|nr:thioesterase family protein [Cognatishimia sp. MH4019]